MISVSMKSKRFIAHRHYIISGFLCNKGKAINCMFSARLNWNIRETNRLIPQIMVIVAPLIRNAGMFRPIDSILMDSERSKNEKKRPISTGGRVEKRSLIII